MNLKKARKNAGLSQNDIAKKLNVSQGAVSQWEQGIRQPSHEVLVKLAEMFDCTIDFLVGRTDDPEYELRTEIPEALKKVGIDAVEMLADADLTPEEIQTLIAFAKDWKEKKPGRDPSK